MALPTISVINFTTTLNDRDVQHAIRAVNRQVDEDFAPIWGGARSLRLHASEVDPSDPDTLAEEPAQGESVMYLIEEATIANALGYHALNTWEVPVGFVFILDPDDWTVTLSHEVLELIIDPTANVLVPGPDPRDPQNFVLHAYEVCDAVETTSYEIDGIRLSNFVTPDYFAAGEPTGSRNDFLGIGVDSFDATSGSHLAFYDLSQNEWITFFGAHEQASGIRGRRINAFQRNKPKRDDLCMQKALAAYKDSPHPLCVKKRKGAGLPDLHGLTRLARHQAFGYRKNKWSFPEG